MNFKNAITSHAAIDASDTPVDLIAENGNRVGLMIYNASSSKLYVLVGNESLTVSSSLFSFVVPANSLYEMPAEYYTTQCTGIWETSPTGKAQVTEIIDN